jgi:hypothetical protein
VPGHSAAAHQRPRLPCWQSQGQKDAGKCLQQQVLPAVTDWLTLPMLVCCLQQHRLLLQGEEVDDWHQQELMLVAPLGVDCLASYTVPTAYNNRHELCQPRGLE